MSIRICYLLKLNLAGLPDRRITEEMLAAVVRPFMQEVEEVHSTTVKKIWRDVILPCGATLITLGLLLLLGWALKMGKIVCDEEICGTIQKQR